jgi:hypothetical protein
MTIAPTISQPPPRVPAPAWDLRWLTAARCRMILGAVLLLGVVSHIRYLHNNCPIDLVGDEAQYWDWSRKLDWSYYSKGPLVACIIRGSCALFGDTMPAVRYPAIALSAGTAIFMYLLTRRLFGSERLALGAVLLHSIVPMFIAGGVLMTIDAPMFFCWAAATYFAAGAIFEKRRWNWPLVGVAIGLGFLAKYAAMLWFVGLFIFLWRTRKEMRGALIALAIALLMTLPVLIWNAPHNWVSFRHVARQTGASGGGITRGNFFEFIVAQIGVVGPILFVMTIFAIVHAVRRARADEHPHGRKLLFLMWIGVPVFALTLLISLFTKVQVNWPAPAYITLIILTAHYLGTRLKSESLWRPWRGWFWATVVIGVITIPIAHDSARLFPIARMFNINPAKSDFLARLRGWKMLGQHVTHQLNDLGDGSFVLCDDYMQTAQTAFYVAGQPKTYYAGSYYADAKRFTQYDLWPDRALDDPKLRGRNAVYVGKGGAVPPDIQKAFEKLEPLPELPVVAGGVTVKTFKTWRGIGFKGMTRPRGPGEY